MTWFGSAAHSVTEWVLTPLDWFGPLAALIIVTIATGALALWVLKLTSRPENLVRARHQMAAAVYEMRLYLDAPARILRAQIRLVGASLWYTWQTLPGLLILTVPLGMLYVHLDLRHGYARHAEGSSVMLGVLLFDPVAVGKVSVQTKEGKGVEVTLGPIVAEREGAVYYRLRVTEPGRHHVEVRVGEEIFDKVVVADAHGPVSVERVAGVSHAWSASVEAGLPSDGPVERIWVSQDVETDVWFGLPWWVIWLVGSTAAALFLRRPMGAEL